MVGGHEPVVYFDVTLNLVRYVDDVRPRDGIILTDTNTRRIRRFDRIKRGESSVAKFVKFLKRADYRDVG